MFTFENCGTNTYLVYKIKEEDTIDSMSLGMLTNNKIAGLAATHFTQMDSDRYLKYNVSAKVSVKQFFTGPVNKKRLIGVFLGVVNAILSAEDYMIDIKTINFDLDYIFTDVSTCETVLICLPVMSEQNNNFDLGEFIKKIMFSTKFDQTENCDYVAKIINYLNSTPIFSVDDFKSLLIAIKSDNVNSSVNNQINVQRNVYQNKSQPVQVVSQAQAKPVTQPSVQSLSAQPVVKSDTTATNSYANNPSLIKQENKEIPVKKDAKIKVNPNELNIPDVSTPVNMKQTNNNEKKMSLFGLLTHYSKENKELYKAQKASQKADKATVAPVDKVPSRHQSANNSFLGDVAVPGQVEQIKKSIPEQTPLQKQGRQPQVKNVVSNQPIVSQANVSQTNVSQANASQANVSQTNITQPAFVQVQSSGFGETTVLGGGIAGETTVLNISMKSKESVIPYLLRLKNNEKIPVNKPVFRIGKERSYVDYFIGDNTAISRSHANIVEREGEYYIVDTNSTNHTFVNGLMINSNIETKISHGFKIRLANEDFEFKTF